MTVEDGVTVTGKGKDEGLVGALGRWGASVTSLNQGLELLGKIGAGVTATLKATTGESLEQDRIYNRLSGTLGRMGIEYEAVNDQLGDFFAHMQEVTRYGDTDMAAALNQIALATGALSPSIDDLEYFGTVAADVAEATGQDLAGAATIVGQAAAGSVERLGRLIPASRDLIEEIAKIEDPAERGARAMELLSEQFGGAAESINPLDLALARIRNGMGDLREGMGDVITQNPQVAAAFDTVADSVDMLAGAFSEGGIFAEQFGDVIGGTAELAASAMQMAVTVAIYAMGEMRTRSLEFEQLLERTRNRPLTDTIGDLQDIRNTQFNADGTIDPEAYNRAQERILGRAQTGQLPGPLRDEVLRAMAEEQQGRQRGIEYRPGQSPIDEAIRSVEAVTGAFDDMANSIDGQIAGVDDEIGRLLRRFEEARDAIDAGSGGGSGSTSGAGDAAAGADQTRAALTDYGEAYGQVDATWVFDMADGFQLLAESIGLGIEALGEFTSAEEKVSIKSEEWLEPIRTKTQELQGFFVDTADVWRDMGADISMTAIGVGTDMLAAFGATAAGADKSFDAIMRSGIAAIGGIAKQTGSMFILQALGFGVIPGLQANAGVLAGAGAGLLVLGGVLEALGGKSTPTHRGAGSGSSGGFSGSGVGDVVRRDQPRLEFTIDHRTYLDGEVVAQNTYEHNRRGAIGGNSL